PEQMSSADDAGAGTGLIVNVYGEGSGRFELYEDDGLSLDYQQGRYALTPMTYRTSASGHELVIGPTTGSFAGQRESREYELRLHAAQRPASISLNGRRVAQWHWRSGDSTADVMLPVEAVRHELKVTW